MSKRLDEWIVTLARGVIRWRWLTLFGCLLAVAAMVSGGRLLTFSTDYRVYFGPENPQLMAFDEVQNVYNKNDITMVVIEPR